MHAVDERLEHQRMVVEVGRLDELDLGMARRDRVGRVVDALHQDAGEQEIREDDDAAEAEPRGLLQRRLDERKGDAGIAVSAQPNPSPSHSMRVTLATLELASGSEAPRPTTTSSVSCAPTSGRRDAIGLRDAVAGGADHARVEPEIAAVFDATPRIAPPDRC